MQTTLTEAQTTKFAKINLHKLCRSIWSNQAVQIVKLEKKP